MYEASGFPSTAPPIDVWVIAGRPVAGVGPRVVK
jgi:hypothetical protein